MRGRGTAWALLLYATACASEAPSAEPEQSADASAAPVLTIEALQDPRTCEPCHVQHYREWEGSMHAYAAQDPVFIAMNERGQQQTSGELGEFCVRCHAPMALALGLTRDGLNLPDLDDPNARGVTCYYCHDVTRIDADHNAGPGLAHDAVMRGGIGGERAGEAENTAAAIANPAHASAYSARHDGTRRDSAELCGSCHDVVNGHGVPIERTFAEWRSSRFASAGDQPASCASCHMPRYDGRLAPDGPMRRLHRHLWPGVDVALERSFPGQQEQAAAIDCALTGALELTLVALQPASDFDRFEVTLTNLGVGHAWPSGAAQDRRAWVELVAYDSAGEVSFQSGVVAEGEVVGAAEPSLQVLRDRLFAEDGHPVHMFWEAAPGDEHPLGYESDLLPPPPPDGAPAPRTVRYDLPAAAARVTARLRLQAIGLDVLDDFAGVHLPITERVLQTAYNQRDTLRSRIRTLTVPGTERALELRDGEVVPSAPEPSSCEETE